MSKITNDKRRPSLGIEEDVVYGRKIYHMTRQTIKYIKRLLNKKFRRYNKNIKNFQNE